MGSQRWCGILVLFVITHFDAAVAYGPPTPDFKLLAEEAVALLSEYLKIESANPPGNELEGAEFLQRILRREGIRSEIIESAPGRANLYARLQGDRSLPPLVLLHHLDVVPAAAQYWSAPPFSGEIRDGAVWGRGALDSKGLGITHLVTFLSLKRQGQPLKRDVIFLATADEEQGGKFGAGWLVEQRPDLFDEASFVLNEGGGNLTRNDRLVYVGVEVTQKLPLWLRLIAESPPGHGSVPRGATAPARLVRALDRILRYQPPVRLTPSVARYFKSLAPLQGSELRIRFARIEDSVSDPQFVARLNPAHQALLRNTVALTVLRGGERTNVIPPVATAELDCRLLPDQDPEEFLNLITRLINDPSIQIETLLQFSPAESTAETELFESIRRIASRLDPPALVGPSVLQGFTDSYHLRKRGITAYGFSPFPIPEHLGVTVHGNDERLPIQSLEFGVRFFYEVISSLVF